MIQLSLRFRPALLTVAAACLFTADFALAAKNTTDVTAKVSAAVKDESLSIPATNEMFGDLAPGVPKKLTVEYEAGGQKFTKEAGEGGRVEIAAPAGKKLVILKAIYGPADGSVPVNAAALTETPGEVLETLPGFKVEHVLEADAPRHGSWICMANDPKGRLLLGGDRRPIFRADASIGKNYDKCK